MKKHFKLCFGKSMDLFAFGCIGSCKGMYSGGYNNYAFGIKYVFGIKYLECWGDFNDMKL